MAVSLEYSFFFVGLVSAELLCVDVRGSNRLETALRGTNCAVHCQCVVQARGFRSRLTLGRLVLNLGNKWTEDSNSAYKFNTMVYLSAVFLSSAAAISGEPFRICEVTNTREDSTGSIFMEKYSQFAVFSLTNVSQIVSAIWFGSVISVVIVFLVFFLSFCLHSL